MTLPAAILENPMPTEGNIADALITRVSPATLIRRDEPLAKHTTMRIGGPADCYVEPASEADLADVLKFCAERAAPFFILGRGSNLLVRDGGVRGVVICLAHPHLSKIEIVDERLHCGAGAKLKNVSIEAKRNNLSGVEFLEGIPGSVGGALRMNAGAMGAWTFGAVESLRFMDYAGEIHERIASEVPVEYRACPLLKTHIGLGAVFKCVPLPREEIEKRMMAYSEKRWESQPAAPSAGCIFKNPGTIPAGKLVDELGLKGTRVGGAVVSAEHGNFIVNDGKATARDVLELIAILKAKVKAERGIELHTEVEIIGEEKL
jgi:UDP-N-acetylenolpyruvoylglucosamine reductase